MRLIRSLLLTLSLLTALAPTAIQADEPADSAAARYIRTLFDATLPESDGLSGRCSDLEPFGRFAAGRLWQALSDTERMRFNHDFCVLAGDAVGRLKHSFSGLTLAVTGSRPAAQGMMSVQSTVTKTGAQQWPVDWLIAGPAEDPHLADLRVLGISLGIFLRGLAATQWPDKVPESLTSAEILRPWRQALDRALPPPSVTPPR